MRGRDGLRRGQVRGAPTNQSLLIHLEGEGTMAERSKRGFASMDKEKQRTIASKGGKAAHQKGTAHEFTSEEAVAAGRKGGKAAHAKGTAHQLNRPTGSGTAEENPGYLDMSLGGQPFGMSSEQARGEPGRPNQEERFEGARQPAMNL